MPSPNASPATGRLGRRFRRRRRRRALRLRGARCRRRPPQRPPPLRPRRPRLDGPLLRRRRVAGAAAWIWILRSPSPLPPPRPRPSLPHTILTPPAFFFSSFSLPISLLPFLSQFLLISPPFSPCTLSPAWLVSDLRIFSHPPTHPPTTHPPILPLCARQFALSAPTSPPSPLPASASLPACLLPLLSVCAPLTLNSDLALSPTLPVSLSHSRSVLPRL
jgi:hypothetical protein